MDTEISVQNLMDELPKLNALGDGLNGEQPFTVVIGATGGGKSTLLNFLLFNEIQIVKVEQKHYKFHVKNQNAPKIGDTNTSCTQLACLFRDPQGKIYFDCAGTNDSKGPLQDILNSIANANILKKTSRIKVILVIELMTAINARSQYFSQISKYLEDQFQQDYQAVVSEMIIVFSKVNTSDYELNDLKQIMQEKLEQEKTSPKCKFMLHQIIEKNHFVMFPKPCKDFNDYLGKIQTMAETQQYVILSDDAQISLVESSKYQVLSMRKEIQQKMLNFVTELDGYTKQYYKVDKIDQLAFKMTSTKKALKIIQNIGNSQNIIKQDYITTIRESLSSIQFPKNQLQNFLHLIDLYFFCLKLRSQPLQFRIETNIKQKLQVLLNSFERKFQKNSSRNSIKALKKKFQEVEKELEIKNQKKAEELKRKHEVMIQELEKQKEKLKRDQESYERKIRENQAMELEKMGKLIDEEKKKKMEEEKIYEEMNTRRHPTDSGNGHAVHRIPQSSNNKQRTLPQNNFRINEQPPIRKDYQSDIRSEMHNFNGTEKPDYSTNTMKSRPHQVSDPQTQYPDPKSNYLPPQSKQSIKTQPPPPQNPMLSDYHQPSNISNFNSPPYNSTSYNTASNNPRYPPSYQNYSPQIQNQQNQTRYNTNQRSQQLPQRTLDLMRKKDRLISEIEAIRAQMKRV